MAIDMDAAAIRQWAWGEAQRYRPTDGSDDLIDTRLGWADKIAAWRMSGTLPAVEPAAEPSDTMAGAEGGGDPEPQSEDTPCCGENR